MNIRPYLFHFRRIIVLTLAHGPLSTLHQRDIAESGEELRLVDGGTGRGEGPDFSQHIDLESRFLEKDDSLVASDTAVSIGVGGMPQLLVNLSLSGVGGIIMVSHYNRLTAIQFKKCTTDEVKTK
jgi:hypothetical protein